MDDTPRSGTLRRARLLLWTLVALAAIGVAVLLFTRREVASSSAASGMVMGGTFTLADTAGRPFPSSRLDGKPYAIFFGFTHCPDVCPTTLARLARLRQSMGGNATFNIVFVSIDPERDSPQVMGDYAKMFGTPIIALTGSIAQIEQVKKSYGVYAKKAPGSEHAGHSGYSMNHTSSVLLYDRDNRLTGMISITDNDDAVLTKLREIVA